MEVINKLKIDLLKPGVKPMVSAMQADENSRVLEITLNANGSAWEIPDGVSFSVAYKKPDGTRGLYDTMPDGTSASSVDGNVVSIRLAPQMLTAPGTVNTSVVISSGDQRISTFPIIVNVIQNPAVGAVGSEDYFYSSVIGNLDDLKTTNKTSLVAAINEIFSTGGSGSNSGQNQNVGSGVWYGTTSTPMNTAEKVVATVTGNFKLVKGARLGVKFLTDTVNCNSLIVDGLEKVYIRSTNDEAGNSDSSLPIVWHNLGQVQWFTYDGEYFIMDDAIRATAANSLCGKVSVSDSVSSTGDTVASSKAVKIAYDKAVDALKAVPDDDHINSLINTALGVIENGTY